MAQAQLTDKFCIAAKCRAGRKVDHFDMTARGLCFRVTAAGAKAWFVVYGPPAKRQWLKIGTYPDIGVAKARTAARDARIQVGGGKDPVAEKKAAAAGDSVADMVTNYIARQTAGNRSAAEIGRRLRKNVADVIGDVKLTNLHRRDLTKCIDAVVDRGATVEANRVFEDLRAMIRWARGRGDLDENLAEGMKRPTETKERDRWLSEDELPAMWTALATTDMRESTRRILRLCLATAQRVGEVAGLTRAELDLENATWTIPAARSKNGREHKVPLSGMALEIVRQQITDVDDLARRKGRVVPPWIFPGPGAKAAVTGAAVAKAVARQEWPIAHFTPHDLRRTAATHMAKLSVPPFIIAHVLNHASVTRADVTNRHYAHYDYAKEKRAALEGWADRLLQIVKA